MTAFRFLHAADLHLGSPFRGLSLNHAELAQRFAEATRTAFANLVDRAIAEAVDFAIIAGDVYDGDWKDNTIGLFFNRQVARLDRAGIPLFLLKGNHDAQSVVTKSILLPDSVRQFDTKKPSSFLIEPLQVALHGQGFADRSASENLALGYPAPVPGWFNIGVLHTALTGRPPHASYAPCSIEDLRGRGYDYWALSHVHDFEIVARDPAIVFPGNLQGRNIRETGAKGAVIVGVEDGQVTGIERLVVDEARWGHAEVPVDDAADFPSLLRLVEGSVSALSDAAEDRMLMVRIRLVGQSFLHPWLVANRASARDEMQAALHRVHADIWLEKLELGLFAPPLTARPAGDGLSADLSALVDAAAGDPDLAARARALVDEIAAKLPGGLGAGETPLGEDLAELLAEARAVVLHRANRAG